MDSFTKKHLQDILWSIVVNHLPVLKKEVGLLLKE